MSANIEISAEEKRADHGQTQVNFRLSVDMDVNSEHFATFFKVKDGKNLPIYKTECKKSNGSKIQWSQVRSNTDVMFDRNNDTKVKIFVYKYNSQG